MKYIDLSVEEKYFISVIQKNFDQFDKVEKARWVNNAFDSNLEKYIENVLCYLSDDNNFKLMLFNQVFGFEMNTAQMKAHRELLLQKVKEVLLIKNSIGL